MSDLPRLLLCCFDVVPAPTAISRRLTEYLKSLSERYQVVVLTVKTPDHTHIERYHGARLLRVPVGSGDLAARVQAFDRAVRRQLDSEEYVMVHFFDPFGGYALCERRGDFGYKLVYDACTLPSVDLPFLYGEVEANRRFLARVRRQELYCLMNADVVIVANDVTRDFVTGLGVSREQVQVLPAPVDLGPYDPKVMGPPTGDPMRLIHLGNQSAAQDLGLVLEALALARKTADVVLTIVGPKHEEHQARLEEQVARLGLAGKVEFQPPVAHDDLHKVMAAADVGLLTLADVERNSRVGSPLSRLGEYLAAGRPVIAADVASARSLLPDDGVVLYRPQDVGSLADAIGSLAAEPTRRIRLGAAARAAALERDAAKVRADLVAIYVALSGTGVRAVGDADATNSDEPTQLGRTLDSEDTQRRKAERARTDPPSGTNKVKTDPAIVAAEENTTPEMPGGTERPAVMGVPLREDPPVVLGQDIRDLAAELAQVTTEPNAQRHLEPPVVMGMPLAQPPMPFESSPTLPPTAPDEPTPAPAPPAPLDEVPDTGPHLSLVPREPDPVVPASATMASTDEVSSPAAAPAAVEERVVGPSSTGSDRPGVVDSVPDATGLSEPVEDRPTKQTILDTPVVIPPLEIPPLTVPPLAAAPRAPAPPPMPTRTSSSGMLPVVPPPPRPPSASQVIQPLELPPPLTSSPSGLRNPSGNFAAVPPLPPLRTSSTSLPAVPPPLARTTSGIHAVIAPPTPGASGLFPTPPAVPAAPPKGPGTTGVEEISESEIEEVADDEVLEAPAAEAADDAPNEVPEESVMTVDTDPSPPPSAIDPWLAQLVHGYCPPESGLFERHTPPTTMPGRDT